MKKESKSMIIETIITFDSEREDISVDNWNVYTSSHIFKEIFGKTENNFKTYARKRKVIKITSLDTKHSIYRFWNGAPLGAKTKDTLFLDKNAKYDLLADKNKNTANIILSKGSKLKFYLNHYDHMVRVSFKLGIWSVIVGIVSFIIGIISIFC